jgi:hypothetical protein
MQQLQWDRDGDRRAVRAARQPAASGSPFDDRLTIGISDNRWG